MKPFHAGRPAPFSVPAKAQELLDSDAEITSASKPALWAQGVLEMRSWDSDQKAKERAKKNEAPPFYSQIKRNEYCCKKPKPSDGFEDDCGCEGTCGTDECINRASYVECR